MAYNGKEITTKRGYPLAEVASALQKAIRRGDERLAGYWGIEIFESGFQGYLWRRLCTVSAEDCWGILSSEVESLMRFWESAHAKKKGGGRIFASKAIILLCLAKKSRDADHLTNLLYDKSLLSDNELEADLAKARMIQEPIPDYALDVHTKRGKFRGKTKTDFFIEEQDALKPKQIGLFDEDLEAVRSGKIKL